MLRCPLCDTKPIKALALHPHYCASCGSRFVDEVAFLEKSYANASLMYNRLEECYHNAPQFSKLKEELVSPLSLASIERDVAFAELRLAIEREGLVVKDE